MARPRTSKAVLDRGDACCVVGAGSSGLTAAKNLIERGFAVDVIEREDELGGNWNFKKPNARVYASTHTISSKPFTQYPDFPMPDAFPDYPHHTQILSYLRSYARHFGLLDHTHFETSVERIEADEANNWLVTLRDASGSVHTRRYRNLVIANGHNWHPKMPHYPGAFSGEHIHSAAYRDPSIFAGKRVLVIGAGNTGCDVAVEAADHARKSFHSTRRGYWYAPRYVFGKPADQLYDLFLSARLPLPVLRFCLETTARFTVGDVTRVGLARPDHKFLETHPIINSQLVDYVGRGKISPRGDIERFDGQNVHFIDGRVEQIDMIVSCTGYQIRFPFIDEHHLNWVDGRPRLYKNVFHPSYDNLFVIGLLQPDSGQFKLVHWQSVAVAKYLQARTLDPWRAAAFRREVVANLGEDLGAGVHYKESTRHLVEVQHMDYLRGLGRIIDSLTSPGA
ncbi:MAG: NAD(P)-binding domain-containing protein [Bradymonadaceae bacterium]|nr:NAD(P)-binding domain-containing protein [Lujinxingiaceae bacterium]